MNMHNARTFMHTDPAQHDRRSAILRILRGSPVRRQAELVALLRREGHTVTQSSISRDLRDLGVLKAAGRYLPPTDEDSRTLDDFSALRQFVRGIDTAGDHLTVLRTTIGAAQSVAIALDKADWDEVAGTISGDDTIFIATRSSTGQRALVARLRDLFRI
ncbi:MAG: arginine repressor [Steroidobacteraceae bacterium]|jgi:transcriptional regulator of arginine metabolism|nr:arginine repressor [Gammaproteobacteria bacterium]